MNPTRRSTQKVLVTGAGGFLGEQLARTLVQQGCSVVGTIRRRPVAIPGARIVACDWADPEAARDCLRLARPDAVFHVAAMTSGPACEKKPAQAHRDIVQATRNLAHAAREFAPKARLVSVSTDLVFDGTHAPYRVGDSPNPTSVYGKKKLEAEAIVLDLPAGAVVRSALLYGPSGTNGASFLGWMLGSLRSGKEVVLFSDEFRTPVESSDLVAGLIGVAAAGGEGLWHAGGPERIDRLTMGKIACRVFDLPERLLVDRRLDDVLHEAPRPRDVSLVSERFWSLVGREPVDFEYGLRRVQKQT